MHFIESVKCLSTDITLGVIHGQKNYEKVLSPLKITFFNPELSDRKTPLHQIHTMSRYWT